MILDGVAVALVILAGVNVTSTSILVAAAARHRWPALEERATVAVVLALVAVGAAMLGLNRLEIVGFSGELALGILAVALLLVNVPSVLWVIAYRTGRFDEPDSSGQAGRP